MYPGVLAADLHPNITFGEKSLRNDACVCGKPLSILWASRQATGQVNFVSWGTRRMVSWAFFNEPFGGTVFQADDIGSIIAKDSAQVRADKNVYPLI